MFNGHLDKLYGLIAIPGLWITSIELRLRGKVGKGRFNDLKTQMDRQESHLWDIMKAQGIKPSRDLPERVTNDRKRRKGDI